MIELVLVYCLSSDTARCVEQRDVRMEVGSPIMCMMQAQIRAQEYQAAHPRLRLASWRCEVDRPREDPA